MVKKIIIVMIIGVIMGCRTSHCVNFAAEIGDSLFIYIKRSDINSNDKTEKGRLIECYKNSPFCYRYMYWIDNDSLYLDDQSQLYNPFPVKVSRQKITIYKSCNIEGIFYKRENIDSIELQKVSSSFIDETHKKYKHID